MTIFLTYCSLGETSFELYFKCKWDLDNITIYIFYIKKIIQTFYLFENHEALFCLFPCIQLMQVVKKMLCDQFKSVRTIYSDRKALT